MDKEAGIGTYSSLNDRVTEEKREQVIGQNPKAEVAPFSSAEMGIRKLVFWTEVVVRGRGSGAKLRAKKQSRVFRTAVGVIRCIETVAEIPGKSGKNLGQEDNRCLQAKLS